MDDFSFYSELVEMLSGSFGRELRHRLDERLSGMRVRRRNLIEGIVDEDSYNAQRSSVLGITARIKSYEELLSHFFDIEGLKSIREELRAEVISQD